MNNSGLVINALPLLKNSFSFLSPGLQNYLYENFFTELEALHVPYTGSRKNISISDLNDFQKIYATIYKIKISKIKLLILDHLDMIKDASLANFIFNIIDSILSDGITVLLISNDIRDTLHRCPLNYVFYRKQFIGSYAMDKLSYEDLLVSISNQKLS